MILTMFADTLNAASYKATKPPLSMQILGKKVTPAPIIYKDKVYVPLRALGENLDYQVNYSDKAKTMDLVSKTHKVTLTVGYIYAKVNGANVKMEQAPILSNKILFVPLSFVQKNFKYNTEFLSDKNMVAINKQGTQSSSASVKPAAQTPAKAAVTNGIYIMDKKVNNTENAIVKSGIVFIPLRLVGESLDYKVTWSSSTKTMTLSKANQTILVLDGKTSGSINKKAFKLEGTPFLSTGRLYVPLSFISKNLGYTTTYDSKLNKVAITQKVIEEPKAPAEVPKKEEPSVPSEPVTANIVNVTYEEESRFPQINIHADSAMEVYNVSAGATPDKLVIDIPKAVVKTDFQTKEINQGGILGVEVNQLSADAESGAAKIVVSMDSQKPYQIVQSSDKKTISILYANIISPISYEREGSWDIITITGTADMDYSAVREALKVIVDVDKAVIGDLQYKYTASSEALKAIRVGQFTKSTARIVLDVYLDAHHKVEKDGNSIKIYLSKYPFEFVSFNEYFSTSVLYFSPGQETLYSFELDELNNRLKLIIPQDLQLQANRVEINNNFVKYIDVATEIMNGAVATTAVIQMQDGAESEVLTQTVAAKLIKVRFKRKITSLSQLTVVVDAGHGAKDNGASGKDGTREKNLNLDVALKLEKHLKALGFNILMTRRDDTFIELQDRANLANTNNADFFMSIHFNSTGGTKAAGIEHLYYPNILNDGNDISNKRIAEVFQLEVLKATKRGSRGVIARPELAVLNKSKMPAILTELGFLSNPAELALVKTEKYREDCARALAVSMLKYFRDIQGVPLDLDPDSIYTMPYEWEAVQTVEQTAEQAVVPAATQTSETLEDFLNGPVPETLSEETKQP